MAKKQRVVVSVDLEAQAKQFDQVIENSKQALKGLGAQLTPRQFEQLNRMLSRMGETMSNVRKSAKSGFGSQSEFDNATKKISEMGSAYERFLSDLRSFDVDPKKVVPATKEFAKLQDQIEKANKQLKELQESFPSNRPAKGYKGLESKYETAMRKASARGDAQAVSHIAQSARGENSTERQSLGTSIGIQAKKKGVSKDQLGDTLIQERDALVKQLEGLGKATGKPKLAEEKDALRAQIKQLEVLIKKYERYVSLRKEVENINQAEKDYKAQAGQVSSAQGRLQGLYEEETRQKAGPQAEVARNLENINNSGGQTTQILEDVNAEINKSNESWVKQDSITQNMGGLKSYLTSLVSATAIFMRLRQAVQQTFQDFQEIDKELNDISIVTGKSMEELWNGFSNLNSLAQKYGVTTKNVIEVQKLYYQQGRNAVEVTQLTGETLKFAKISGLEFAQATDYMTSALNAYNIAAKDANEITDTYSALSAAAAVDSQEVAIAMSKVASMAASAGSSFKDTSAYLSKIIETTREAPETA